MSATGREFISSGSTFESQIGYSRAVVVGDWVFVSGTSGFDYESMTLPEGVLEQTEQCLRNIASALERAGSSLDEVVRVTYLVPNGDDFEATWPALREAFGVARPAATVMSVALLDPEMRIEIEVTALKGSAVASAGDPR
ncbi:MAG: RidA family protein [Salinibacterium sp.]|nr:MAG: RidA family protein [Salinibacterium sp.]